MRVRAILLAATLMLVPFGARAEIMLGVAAPFSGPFEYGGEQWQHGVRLAVAEVNAAGGLLGQEVVLDLADDYCDAEQAMLVAQKLVADKVAAVIGHLCHDNQGSRRSLPAARLLARGVVVLCLDEAQRRRIA